MKLVGKILAAIVGLFVLVMALQMVASESGEVVVVTTVGADGAAQETRLWIVDFEGEAYLRAGSTQAQWYVRLLNHPQITVERSGAAEAVLAAPSAADTTAVNELMAQKYGWADAYIGMIFSRDDAMAIRLDPLPTASS
ncbi:MAG: hypothetical protein HC809_05085 [Gammaproteobacteria bacterium]|nr:hypothetical protein [Gammaproteobacteria bacterium]